MDQIKREITIMKDLRERLYSHGENDFPCFNIIEDLKGPQATS